MSAGARLVRPPKIRRSLVKQGDPGSRSRPARPRSRPGSARGRGFRRPSAGPFFGGSPALDRRSAGPRRGLPERPRERAQLAHYAARRPRPLPPSPLRPKGPPRALPRGLTLVVHNRDAPDHTRRKPGISRRSHRFAADFAPTLRREIADRGADRTARSEHDPSNARTWSTGRDEKRGAAQRMPAPTFPERAAGQMRVLSARACRISTRARCSTKNGGPHNACPRRLFPNVQPDKCRLSSPAPTLCTSSDNQSNSPQKSCVGGRDKQRTRRNVQPSATAARRAPHRSGSPMMDPPLAQASQAPPTSFAPSMVLPPLVAGLA